MTRAPRWPPLRRVVAIGAESTGKTQLIMGLAAELGVAWSAEFAREYAERAGGGDRLTAHDVEPIARGQLAAEDAAVAAAGARGDRVVLHDTDLRSTLVYARAYYGAHAVPAWLERSVTARVPDLYFLCDVDVPFTPDPVRDVRRDRAAVQRQFRTALERPGIRVVPLAGPIERRCAAALDAIRSLIDAS